MVCMDLSLGRNSPFYVILHAIFPSLTLQASVLDGYL